MIPPPMSFSDIVTSSNIIDCSISLTGNHIAVLTAVGIDLYEWDFHTKPAAPPQRIASRSFDSEPELWIDSRHRSAVIQGEYRIRIFSQTHSGLSKLTTFIKEGSDGVLMNEDQDEGFGSEKGGQLRGIYTDVNHDFLWGQTSAGISCLNRGDLYVSSAIHPAPQILVVAINGELSDSLNDGSPELPDLASGRTHVFSLSRKGELYSNDNLIIRGCTSFVSTNEHLIFTTSIHLLKFVHIGVSDGRYRELFTG